MISAYHFCSKQTDCYYLTSLSYTYRLKLRKHFSQFLNLSYSKELNPSNK